VLVVDDDESTALFVTRVLTRNGFDASWVMDAEQASERLDCERFDVLLADCRLPGRSGLELARDARRSRPAIGIAVMTSYAEGGTEDTARESGADDFFEKPLHSSNLVARIRDLVARARTGGMEVAGSSSAPPTSEEGPMAAVQEDSPDGEIAEPPSVAESGSDERAVTRDTVSARLDSAVAEDAAHPRPEGTDGLRRTRSSALSVPGGVHDSGCEETCDAAPRGEVGWLDPDLLARASHPAFQHLISQRLLAQKLIEPVIMWASGAPAVSIGSCVGRVTAGRTTPDWIVAG